MRIAAIQVWKKFSKKKKKNEKTYTVIYHPTVPSIFLFFNLALKFIQSQFYCDFDQ